MVKSKHGERPTDPDQRKDKEGVIKIDGLAALAAYLGVPGDVQVDEETNRRSFKIDLLDVINDLDTESEGGILNAAVQGVQDVSKVIKEVQDFVPSTSLRLLDDLTKRYSPAQKLNEMFADIRITAPAMSRLNEQPVSPFLPDPDQSPLNDFINMMRQMSAR